jgi:hypothetical protein
METLRRLRYIVKPNDTFVSLDVKDIFYALSIYPKDRMEFTVNFDGKLSQFAHCLRGGASPPILFKNSRTCS